jgi:hypothetical protein
MEIKGTFEFSEILVKENEILFMSSITCPEYIKVKFTII